MAVSLANEVLKETKERYQSITMEGTFSDHDSNQLKTKIFMIKKFEYFHVIKFAFKVS